MDFFTFYATTCAEKCNHQLVLATTGAFTLTSVIFYQRMKVSPEALRLANYKEKEKTIKRRDVTIRG